MKLVTRIASTMQRVTRILALAVLAVVTLTLCAACSSDNREEPTDKEPSVFKQGTWALSTFEGKSRPDSYSISNLKFDYDERGRILESRKSTNSANIVNGQTSNCTWADDGLSYEYSYTLTTGNFGEHGDNGTSNATFEVEYDELSATYTARGESALPTWERNDDTVLYTLEYRSDGTIRRKEVVGYLSTGSLEVYDYDERGDLVRYEYTMDGEDTPWLTKTYDVTYEGDVPKSVVSTWTYAARDVDEDDNVKTYELDLHADEDGNVISVAEHDGWGMAKMSWVYIENPDPLSRLRIQAEAASPYDLL